MKFRTGRQHGLGNRKYTITQDFIFFDRKLPQGLTTDGASVPKVPILFLSSIILLIDIAPIWVNNLLVIVMLLVGICESSGWFMKPSVVHDYRYQNADTIFGWVGANVEYFNLMVKKINDYLVTNPNNDYFLKVLFNVIIGGLIAVAHLLMLMLMGWIVWFKYYFKNKRYDASSN